MPVYYDKSKKRWRFKFERVINRQQFRLTKVLPAGFTREQAEKFDQEETARLYASATGEKQHLIDDAVLLYLKEHAPQLKRGEEVIRQLQIAYQHYTGKTVAEFVQAASEIRALSLAPGTKVKKIAYIRSALNYAHRFHGFPKPPDVPTIRVNNQRHAYMSRREMLQIASHAATIDARAIIRIAFYTGLRQAEILRLRVIGNRIVILDTKNGEAVHALPIPPKVRSAVMRAPFSLNQNAIRWQWVLARAKAGLKHYRFHDLRHSAASEMINAGIDIYTVGAVLNHRSQASTKRYAHLAIERLGEAINTIGKSRK